MGERVAVLGAGPMGLAVAYQLVQAGHHPVVFEADDRVGGMTACFDFHGLDIERYYHFHCTSDTDFMQLLKELGLLQKMQWVETKMGFWYQGLLQPWGNPFALLRFKGLGLLAKFRYGLHAFWCTRRDDWHSLDKVEATGWIRRWVGAQAYDVLWAKLFEYKFYEYSTHLSAAWIWSRIRRIGRSRYSLFREKLGYLEGGSSTWLNAVKQSIEAKGGEIRLSSPVTRVTMANGRVTGVETKGQLLVFDKVISTVPLPFVPILMPDLPPALLAQYRALKNIAVVCVIAQLRKPVSCNFWVNINDEGMDIPGLVEYSNLRPLQRSVVYVPFYMPGDHAKFSDHDQVFLGKVKKYVMQLNPSICEEDFLHMRASRYRHAQPICKPRHMEMLPPVTSSVRGLWVADTSYYYPEDRGISESIRFGRQLAEEAMK